MKEDQTGVLVSECPVELEYISRYVSPAQILYTSPPNNDWSSWHSTCQDDITSGMDVVNVYVRGAKLTNGNKCPAFTIIARDRSLLDSEDATSTHLGGDEERRKEVLLIISINLQEALAPFSYSWSLRN
jgi:hypothetical protein